MMSETKIPILSELDFISYIDETGNLPESLQGKIGIYAIFDEQKNLQLVNYSRDIYLSLKQHLVRKPQSCYWVKVETIDRPNRSHLEAVRQAWIEENGTIPPGNGVDEVIWNHAIDAKLTMTDEERATYDKSDGVSQIKLLKNIARRVEGQIFEMLESRAVQADIRFNPKLKEQGLLDLK
jgi:hypothetical protein